jgi:tRNA (guanine37-N1)-methyltransferase
LKLKEYLKGKIPENLIDFVPGSFDVVGDIAIFNEFPSELKKYEKIVAKSLMEIQKNIKVVCKKSKKYSGKFRTAKLTILAGEKRKETTHKENGFIFMLDVEKVYFSTRSGTERARISSLIKPNENVLVMFSGCGPFTVQTAKKAAKIVSIEANPIGHKYEVKNIELNKIRNATALKGDVKKVIPLLKAKKESFDRIIMPLPKTAILFLKDALKVAGKNCVIHLYTFGGEEQHSEIVDTITSECRKAGRKCKILQIIKAGEYAPRINRLCVDILVQ